MGRLIDADKLCEYARNQVSRSVDANDIMRFPIVEAELVRHAHWERVGGRDYWMCSNCQAENAYAYSYDDGDGTFSILQDKYCYNCGAKMDEV